MAVADTERLPLGLGITRALSALGGCALAGSLFLVWSHQLPAAERHAFGPAALVGVVADPNAFEVYAIADAVLALLAVAIFAAGLRGRRPARVTVAAAAALGLVFVIHAANTPPTNGVLLAAGSGLSTHYVHDRATAGAGETVALIGLIVGLVGLLGSLAPWHKLG